MALFLIDGTRKRFLLSLTLKLGFCHRGNFRTHVMIPMTPSSSVAYRELEGADDGNYWPSVSPSSGAVPPLSTSGDEGTGAKVRKPYTITKQRERWTEEEHQKFLEALKLYGRAWRRIEEHIGTKTAVQIRSHAQKFFSKIERDTTAETGVAQVIDIPPPRPKRKPTHPYPRKAGRGFGKTSEDDCPLGAAGSISSSSGISTANVVEGCSKGNGWEQDDAGEQDKDAAKMIPTLVAEARPWGGPKPAKAASSSPIAAPTAVPPLSNTSPSPVPVTFPATMPWARIFGGGMNPAMMNPAMMSPTMMNPGMMNPAMMPQGMMMPWVAAGAPNVQAGGLEGGGAVSAIAATIAAASAWWAMQGGMPPGVMHPALGAMYVGGGPPLAIPTPYLFAPQEVTVATAPSCAVDGANKESIIASGSGIHVVSEDIPSSNANCGRSSALRRAERAQRVKELKARRMGSGNHLLSVISDICASTSGGSGAGQLTSESAVNSLSKGVSLPANLNKVEHALHNLVRKDREAATDDDVEKRNKRLRATTKLPTSKKDTIMEESNAHLEKVRSISGSNNLSGQFTKISGKFNDEEATPTTDASQSCGSEAGDVQAEGSNERRGPSSNSSACGNAPGATDRSGSSDGSSEGEATCNVERSTEDNHGRSSMDGEETRIPENFTFNEFLPVCKDGDKPEAGSFSCRLPRTASIDGEQRKEVTERGQIAFQALFKRDTLPRKFSPPPPGLALAEPKPRPASITRSRSANALARKEQDNEQLRGTASASKVQDRCESGVSIPSSRPTKSLEELQSSERRRNDRKGRSHAHSNNWLQLAPTSSLEQGEQGEEGDEDDESADSDPGCQKESFVCKLDLSIPTTEQEQNCSDAEDGSPEGTTSLDVSPEPHHHRQSLSLSTGNCVKQHSSNLSTVSSVSSRTVKYSGVGFVPYQRAPQPLVEKNC